MWTSRQTGRLTMHGVCPLIEVFKGILIAGGRSSSLAQTQESEAHSDTRLTRREPDIIQSHLGRNFLTFRRALRARAEGFHTHRTLAIPLVEKGSWENSEHLTYLVNITITWGNWGIYAVQVKLARWIPSVRCFHGNLMVCRINKWKGSR